MSSLEARLLMLLPLLWSLTQSFQSKRRHVDVDTVIFGPRSPCVRTKPP